MSVHSSDSIRSAPLRPNTSFSASSHDASNYRSSTFSDPPTPHRPQLFLSRSNTANTSGNGNGVPLSPPHTPIPRDPSHFPVYPPSFVEKQAALEVIRITESTVNVVYASDAVHTFEPGILSKTKKEYLVLTNQHLLRFKSQNRANQSLDLFSSNHPANSSVTANSRTPHALSPR